MKLVHALITVCSSALIGCSGSLESSIADLAEDYLDSSQKGTSKDKALGMVITIKGENYEYTIGLGTEVIGVDKIPGAHTILPIGSVSKAFTGVLAALLDRRGKVGFEDSIEGLVSSVTLKTETRGVKLKHVLSHHAGFPRYPTNLNVQTGTSPDEQLAAWKNYSESMMNDYLAGFVPESAPGTAYVYSDVFGFVGHWLAKATGSSLESLLAQELSKQLELTDTFFTAPTQSQYSRVASGYMGPNAAPMVDVSPIVAGTTAIHTTGPDLARFGMALANPPSSELGEAITLATTPLYVTDASTGTSVGAGIGIIDNSTGTYFMKNGNINGCTAKLLVVKKPKPIAIAILTNKAQFKAINQLSCDILEKIAEYEGLTLNVPCTAM